MALFSHEWGCEREIGCSEREECPQGVHRKCRKEGAQLPAVRCQFLRRAARVSGV